MFTKKNVAFAESNAKPESKNAEPLFPRSTAAEPMSTPKFPTNPSATPSNPSTKEPPVNQKPTMPNPPPAFRPDLSRLDPSRPVEAARSDSSRFDVGRKPDAIPAKPEAAPEMRKLIVGRDIALTGEISACDYLVVEGTVEARVREGRHIEIAESGLFRGTVEIDEADIAGRFEGDIMVRGRLKIRGTGRIDGKIQYGELEVENGGHLEGEIHSLKAKPSAADKGEPQVKARSIPVADVAEPAKV
jgi:cytoskeletal protein CcmA (bactofilin family)